jgi:hypothetical protein
VWHRIREEIERDRLQSGPPPQDPQ